MPCMAENWHALSHEQYFSRHRFLDICRCAFKSHGFPLFNLLHATWFFLYPLKQQKTFGFEKMGCDSTNQLNDVIIIYNHGDISLGYE